MKKLIFIFFFSTPIFSSDFDNIKGCFCEGGLIIGKFESYQKIKVNNEPIKLSDDNYFLFAFGRKFEQHVYIEIDGVQKKYHVTKKKYKIERITNLKPRKVNPNKEDFNSIINDKKNIDKSKKLGVNKRLFKNNFIIPVKGRISGVFGSQRILNKVPKRPHYGLDIAAPIGAPIRSPAEGKVKGVFENMFYTGNTIIVDHGLGIISIFAHLEDFYVNKNDIIKKGDLIGSVGKTGRASGPHLHWGVYLKNKPVDPMSLIDYSF